MTLDGLNTVELLVLLTFFEISMAEMKVGIQSSNTCSPSNLYTTGTSVHKNLKRKVNVGNRAISRRVKRRQNSTDIDAKCEIIYPVNLRVDVKCGVERMVFIIHVDVCFEAVVDAVVDKVLSWFQSVWLLACKEPATGQEHTTQHTAHNIGLEHTTKSTQHWARAYNTL